ncbi:MAG TPA: energy transducer TonB [Candidatus Dormibacteraeota bacterium]|jgi:TonB family protein|nr:energy transducer TonB [Candidatus Dormibacteraeota bacterium]
MRHRLVLIFLLMQTLAAAPAQDSNPPQGRKVVLRVNPAYPDLARRMHLAGVVKVQVTIAPDGSVRLVSPVGGNPVLLKAAQESVSRWKYTPAPEETREVVELRFDAR